MIAAVRINSRDGLDLIRKMENTALQRVDNILTDVSIYLDRLVLHADILELGFPHNTPIADGGQIQGSSHRALS